MTVVETRSVFSGIPVAEAMRKQVLRLPGALRIGQGIRLMIRHKANAVLLTENEIPSGVVSKTDLMTAFYAELPVATPLRDVMGGQPIACFADDTVEDAIEIMEAAGVHRLYVTGADREAVIGTVAYADIVGLLYRYCRACERSAAKRRAKRPAFDPAARLTVADVMTREIWTRRESDPLHKVIDTLSTRHLGAVLIQDLNCPPVGVISKTDLILAYLRGVSATAEAREIMNTPVHAVAAEAVLSAAIQQMLVTDVQRLFVQCEESDPDRMVGVLALSDAARFRSGSCRACSAGRMLIR